MARLSKHKLRAAVLLGLAAVEVVYVVAAAWNAYRAGLGGGWGGGWGGGAGGEAGGSRKGGRVTWMSRGAAAALPGLRAGGHVTLPARELARIMGRAAAAGAAAAGPDGSSRELEALAALYAQWRLNTTLDDVVPCRARDTLVPRIRRRVESVEELLGAPEDPPGDPLGDPPLRIYNSDPRLAGTVYYDHIADALSQAAANADNVTAAAAELAALRVPFSWYDWADCSMLTGLIDLPQDQKPNCDFAVRRYFPTNQLLEYERQVGYRLFGEDRMRGLVGGGRRQPANDEKDQYCRDERANPFLPGFAFVNVVPDARPEVYGLQARTHMLLGLELPISLTFLRRNGRYLRVPVANPANDAANYAAGREMPHNVLFNGLLKSHLDRHRVSLEQLLKSDFVFDDRKAHRQLHSVLSQDSLQQAALGGGLVLTPPAGSALDSETGLRELEHSDFEFNARQRLQQLQTAPSLSPHQQHYMHSLQYSLNTHPALFPKFFREASEVVDYVHLGHHFDARFFRGALDYEELRARLDALVKAWLGFAHSSGVATWLAHGTLYGWLYNGQAFPWDADHDVQMPISHLHYLAENFNQTLIVEDPEFGRGRYFLDVTSSITNRINGNGRNNIDARFIDVDSGLYVDITALSVSSDGVKDHLNAVAKDFEEQRSAFTFYEDPNLVAGVNDLELDPLLEQLRDQNALTANLEQELRQYANGVREKATDFQHLRAADRYNINKHIGAFNCRNDHFYTFGELSPLRLTYFHGVPAFVPNTIIDVLRREYALPEAFQFMEYADNLFMPEFRVWIKKEAVEKAARAEFAGSYKDKTPVKVNTDCLSKLQSTEARSLLTNLALAPDSDAAYAFRYISNSFQTAVLRYKELEIMTDKDLTYDQKLRNTQELLRNRTLPAIQKDVFQSKLENVVWSNLLDRTAISYKKIVEKLEGVHLQHANALWDLNVKLAEGNYDWHTHAGHQDPPSNSSFAEIGHQFFKLGEQRSNSIFNDTLHDV
ncbi:LAMI_0G03224g1_1 [Lachancea mirantina]|uniref:LAMI_0G03224g1_1 n=1 Tax=Lachancea mirantina TaxID=1230905 RepID=A0A1G4K815_9SACH|nr:LAMI_0G03224g1_1 [Lachancea mirantina]